MNRNYFALITFVLLLSCSGVANKKNTLTATNDSNVTNVVSSIQNISIDKITALDSVEMLLPGGRYTIGKESKIINNSWKEFYRDSITGNYYVDRAKYTVNTYIDECLEMECEYIESNRNALFFINMPTLKNGIVDSIPIGTGYIAPETPMVIDFNSSKYTISVFAELSAENKGDYEPNKEYSYWCNYKMTLCKDNSQEVELFNIDKFDDSILRLLFAGDIDGDGKLDLIFDSHINYEEESITLFLSSLADNGIITRVAEASISYDC